MHGHPPPVLVPATALLGITRFVSPRSDGTIMTHVEMRVLMVVLNGGMLRGHVRWLLRAPHAVRSVHALHLLRMDRDVCALHLLRMWHEARTSHPLRVIHIDVARGHRVARRPATAAERHRRKRDREDETERRADQHRVEFVLHHPTACNARPDLVRRAADKSKKAPTRRSARRGVGILRVVAAGITSRRDRRRRRHHRDDHRRHRRRDLHADGPR